MKITNKTIRALNKWLEKNEMGCECELGKVFEYEPNDDIIIVPNHYDGEFDEFFMSYLRSEGLISNIDCVALSFLHELGHALTLNDYFTDKDFMNDILARELISYSDTCMEQSLYAYWNLPTEHIAQVFAIDFANQYTDSAQELEDIFATCL